LWVTLELVTYIPADCGRNRELISNERENTMATTKNETSKVEISKVEELGGYCTSARAAELIGLQEPSIHGMVISGKLAAVKFGNVNAILIKSCEEYKAKNAERLAKQREQEKTQLTKRLDEMSVDEIQAYLKSRQSQNGK
jgi:hypothetical protein